MMCLLYLTIEDLSNHCTDCKILSYIYLIAYRKFLDIQGHRRYITTKNILKIIFTITCVSVLSDGKFVD